VLKCLSHENFIFITIKIHLKTNFDRKPPPPVSPRPVLSSPPSKRQSISPRFPKFFQSPKFPSVFNRQLYSGLPLIPQYRRPSTSVNQLDEQPDKQPDEQPDDESSVDRTFKPLATKNLRSPVEPPATENPRPPVEPPNSQPDEPPVEPPDEPSVEPSDGPPVRLSDGPPVRPSVEPSDEPSDEPTVKPPDESPDESLDEPLVESSDELSVELSFKSSTSPPRSSAPLTPANQPRDQQFKPPRSSAPLTPVSQLMSQLIRLAKFTQTAIHRRCGIEWIESTLLNETEQWLLSNRTNHLFKVVSVSDQKVYQPGRLVVNLTA
jgi:hypothetical protein